MLLLLLKRKIGVIRYISVLNDISDYCIIVAKYSPVVAVVTDVVELLVDVVAEVVEALVVVVTVPVDAVIVASIVARADMDAEIDC